MAYDPYKALYLHIPFCVRRCGYCDFATSAVERDSPAIDEYVESLVMDIRRASREGKLGAIETVYLGGGTPSYIGMRRLSMLLYALSMSMHLEPEIECTMEANPESLTAPMVRDIWALGVNRLSIGVQSFDDEVLRILGRAHDAEAARAAVRAAQERFENVSADLMCGIPGQSAESFAESVREAVALGVTHVSVYPLTIEPHTPFDAAIMRGEMDEPDEDVEAAAMEEAQRILKDVKEVIPEDAIIFTDVGWNKNGVAQEFDITVPGTIHHSSGLATMGFGASAVLGGKLAAPDKIVLTLTGDGGFGVNPTCMATAVEKGIACTWVVMNNSAFGTIAGLENANYKTKFGTVFHTPDGESYSPCWADVAKAYGVDSIRCSTADEFKPALEKAIEANKAGKPFLVEAPMENIVVPTPGCWNINDIYSPNELVKEGKLVKKENGQYVAPSHSKSHNA